MSMIYNRLGRAGIKVSQLSFGSWISFGSQVDVGLAKECLSTAREAGVNFFDNAEVYAGGQSEKIMGDAISGLGWPRESYVICTKLYWGIVDGVNTKNTLNRKYLMHAIDGSLQRMGLEFVDLLFCHRPDPDTTIEETVWAMSDIVAAGKALYWGTSEWNADEIRAAYEIAERHHLHKPYMEQPQYNLLEREKVEYEYGRLYDDIGLGLTTWSPLASGLLTGKYLDGMPEGTRLSLPGYEWLRAAVLDPSKTATVRELKTIADEMDVSMANLAIAWCASNPHVSTVITGASKPEQVAENMKSIDLLDQLDESMLARIDKACAPH